MALSAQEEGGQEAAALLLAATLLAVDALADEGAVEPNTVSHFEILLCS
jgi:hypothetical protein